MNGFYITYYVNQPIPTVFASKRPEPQLKKEKYFAIFDGSHRTVAAKKLGLIPELISHERHEKFLDFGTIVDFHKTVNEFVIDLKFKDTVKYVDFNSPDHEPKYLRLWEETPFIKADEKVDSKIIFEKILEISMNDNASIIHIDTHKYNSILRVSYRKNRIAGSKRKEPLTKIDFENLSDRTDLITYAKNNFELKMVDGIDIAFEGSFKFKEKSLSLFLLKHAEGYSLTIERLES